MEQTKRQRAVEVLAGTALGMLMSFAISFFVYPLYGMAGDGRKYISLTVLFTALSLIRSWVVRGVFERIRINGLRGLLGDKDSMDVPGEVTRQGHVKFQTFVRIEKLITGDAE